jgi:segregation and condensation protein B
MAKPSLIYSAAWTRWSDPSGESLRRARLRSRRETDESKAPFQVVGSQQRTPKMARVEAVLLVTNDALMPRKLVQLATLADPTEARTLVNKLNDAYDQAGTPFRIERIAGGYRMYTRPEVALWLGKLHHREAEMKLSPPAMETLTIVAYRQPITRADIEGIRGVQSAEMLKQLMDRGLVRIGGEDDSLGRPFLYETTRKFLESFGLRDLESLPLGEKLRRPSGKPVATPGTLPATA